LRASFSGTADFFSTDNFKIDELADPVAWLQRAEDAVVALIDVPNWEQIIQFFRPFAGCRPRRGNSVTRRAVPFEKVLATARKVVGGGWRSWPSISNRSRRKSLFLPK
jgi:hypothetical protein